MRGCVIREEDRIRYGVIMHIMCNLFIDYERLSEEVGVNVAEHFKIEIDSLDDLEKDGLVEGQSGGLRVTDLGRLLIRIIAMRFDAYLKTPQPKQRFSRTV